MTVHCPHCATAYLLPDHLLGPRGARVRCPACRRPFVVLRDEAAPTEPGAPAAAVVAEATPSDSATVVAEPSRERVTEARSVHEEPQEAAPESVAAEILETLAARLGARLGDARARGRVLAELGPELMKAYDDFRARAGAEAPRETFRAVLKDRWGVDLFGAS